MEHQVHDEIRFALLVVVVVARLLQARVFVLCHRVPRETMSCKAVGNQPTRAPALPELPSAPRMERGVTLWVDDRSVSFLQRPCASVAANRHAIGPRCQLPP